MSLISEIVSRNSTTTFAVLTGMLNVSVRQYHRLLIRSSFLRVGLILTKFRDFRVLEKIAKINTREKESAKIKIAKFNTIIFKKIHKL